MTSLPPARSPHHPRQKLYMMWSDVDMIWLTRSLQITTSHTQGSRHDVEANFRQTTFTKTAPWLVAHNSPKRLHDCNRTRHSAESNFFLTFAFCCRNAVECSFEHKFAERLFYNRYDGNCRSLAPHHKVFNPLMQNCRKIAIKTRPATCDYNIRQES